MALKPTNKNWGENRTINYLGKDFGSFRQNLIDYAKTYFPNTYSDFNESSPGMMFIEMASYIGDVLSFYLEIKIGYFLNAISNSRNTLHAYFILNNYLIVLF